MILEMSFTSENLGLYVNIGLYVLFGLIVLGLLIAALVGYKKGVFSSTFRLLFMGMLVVLAICLLNPTASLIGNIPINKIIGTKSIVMTNTASNRDYTVPITTVFDTVREFFKGYYILFNVSGGSSVTPSSYSLAVAISIVKLITFLMDLIFILIFGNLLSLILWHALFKHLIPKIARKKIKLPWVGMIERMVTYLLLMFLFMSPLSSMINIASQAYKRNKLGDSSNSTVQMVGTFLDTYNNSLIANAFFNWTVDDNGLTIDAKFISSVTAASIDETAISIIDEINNIASVASAASILIDNNNQFTLSPLLSGEVATEALMALFDSIQNSNLIMGILPIAATMAVNSDLLGKYLDTSMMDVSDIDWSKELFNIEQVAADILDTGILTHFVDAETGEMKKSIDTAELFKSMISTENYSYYKRVISSIDDSKLLSRAVPCLLSYLASTNSDLGKYLPSSWDELNDISWGFELSLILDSCVKLINVDNAIVDYIVDGIKNKTTKDKEFTSDLIKKYVVPNFDVYKSVLLGKTLDNGQIDTSILDKDGRTVVYKKGSKISGRYYSLFDSQLMKYVLSPMSELLLSSMSSSLDDTQKQELSDTLDSLSSGTWMKKYKEEFASIFYVIDAVKDNDTALNALLDDPSAIIPDNDFSKMDSEVVLTLAKALNRIDDSKLLSAVVTPAIRSALLSEDTKKTLTDIGLDVDIIETGLDEAKANKRIGKELASLVKVLPNVGKLTSKLNNEEYKSDSNKLLKALGEDYADIALILDSIYNNQIINPKSTNDKNYYNVLEYVFKQVDFSLETNKLSDVKWSNSYDMDGNFYKDKYGNPIFNGENGYIANVIRKVGLSGIVGELSSLGSSSEPMTVLYNFETTATYNLKSILAEVETSAVFKSVMGSFLDKNMESTGIINEYASFENVSNWEVEGNNLHRLILCFKDFELNMSNLDVSQVTDIVKLNDVLHALANSTIFDHVEEDMTTYTFGNWLYSKLISAGSSSSSTSGQISFSDLFKDPDNETKNAEGYTDWDLMSATKGAIKKPSDSSNSIFKYDIESLDSREDWAISDYEYDFDTSSYASDYWDDPEFKADYVDNNLFGDDEIGSIIKILYYGIQMKLFATDGFKISNITSNDFQGLMEAMNDAHIFRIAIYNIYRIAADSIKDNDSIGFDLSGAFTPYLVTTLSDSLEETEEVKANRKEEIQYLVDILEGLKTVEDKELFTDGALNAANLDSDTATSLKKVSLSMNKSKVFHRLGNKKDNTELTTFQNVLDKFYTCDSIKIMIYSPESPKDAYYAAKGNYDDYLVKGTDGNTDWYKTKSNYMLRSYFSYDEGVYSYSSQEEEIANMFETVSSIIAGPKADGSGNYPGIVDDSGEPTIDFSKVKWVEANTNSIRDYVFPLLIKTETLKDAPCNILNDRLDEIEFSGSEFIDLKSINAYYHYFKDSSTNPNFEYTYDEGDFDFIPELLSNIGDEDDHNKINYIVQHFDNITAEQVDVLSDFLKTCLTSSLTHTSGPKLVFDTLDESGNASYKKYETGNTYTNGSTFMQQIMMEFYAKFQEKDGTDYKQNSVFFNSNNDKDAYIYSTAISKITGLPKSYFKYGVSDTELSLQEDEIDAIFESMKSILGDSGLVDSDGNSTSDFSKVDWGNDGNVTIIETFLKNLNETDTLCDSISNILDTRLSDLDVSESNIDITAANVFYQYRKNNDYSSDSLDITAKLSDSDIEYIISLLRDYNNKDSDNSLFKYLSDISTLTSEQVDALGEKMVEMNNQPIFHIAGPRNGKELTVFQQVMKRVYTTIQGNDSNDGAFYNIHNPKDYFATAYTSADTKGSYVASSFFKTRTGFDKTKQNEEVRLVFASIGYIFGTGDNAGLKRGDGENTLDFSEVTFEGDIGAHNFKVVGLVLEHMNSTDTLFDVVPNGLDKCFRSVNIESGNFSNVNLVHSNLYYQYGEIDSAGEAIYSNKMDESDIIYITNLLTQYTERKTNEESIFYLIDHADNLTSAQANILGTKLKEFRNQNIFHVGGSVTTKTGITNTNDTTVFQEIMMSIYTQDSLSGYFFNADSTASKDYNQSTLYSDAKSKALYITKNFFTSVSSIDVTHKDEVDKQNAEIDKIASFTKYANTFKTLGDSTDFSSFDDTTIETINSALTLLDTTETMYDIVPNAMYKMFNSTDAGIDGLDLRKASPYFNYTYSSSTPDYSARYNTASYNEIETICSLIKDIRDMKSFDFKDVSSLTDDKLDTLRNGLLADAYSSNSLHLSNQYSVSKNTANDVTTVFEDIVYKLYNESGLDEFAYDSSKDTSYSGVKDKTLTMIRNTSRYDENISGYTNSGFNNSWNDANGELDDIITLVKDGKTLLSSGASFASLNIKNLEPDKTKTLMIDINALNTLCDALPKMVKDRFTNIGLNTYSSISGKDKAYFYFDQVTYGGDDNSAPTTSEIDKLYNLFVTLQGTDGVADFDSSAINEYLKDSSKTTGLLTFIKNSKIYNTNPDEPTSSAWTYNSVSVTTSGLFLNNAFHTIDMSGGSTTTEKYLDDYILNNHDHPNNDPLKESSTQSRVGLLSKIIEVMNPTDEGVALTEIVKSASGNLNANTFDGSGSYLSSTTMTVITDAMRTCYDAYNNETNIRSYLASEIVAGFLSDIMETEYVTAAGQSNQTEIIYFGPKEYTDFTVNSYSNINALERSGVTGAIEIYEIGSSITTTTKAKKSEVEDAFNKMGMEIDSAYKNSLIALNFYSSRIGAIVDGLYKTAKINPINPYTGSFEPAKTLASESNNIFLDTTFRFDTYGKQVGQFMVDANYATDE